MNITHTNEILAIIIITSRKLLPKMQQKKTPTALYKKCKEAEKILTRIKPKNSALGSKETRNY